MRKLLALVVVLLVLAPALALAPRAAGSRAEATHVYWTNPHADAIGRAKIDGTGVSQRFIRTRGNGPRGIAVDPAPVLVAYVYSGPRRHYGPRQGQRHGRGPGLHAGVCCGLLGGRGRCQVPFPARSGARLLVSLRHRIGLGRANINGTGANYQLHPLPRALRTRCSPSTARTFTGPFAARARLGAPSSTGPIRIGGSSARGAPPRGRGQRRTRLLDQRGHDRRANLDGTDVDRRFIRTRGHPYGIAVLWCRARLLGRRTRDRARQG